MLKQYFLPRRAVGLRAFNNWLTLLIVVLACYIIVVPYLPQVEWWVTEESPLHALSDDAPQEPSVEIKDNRLFIPKLKMSEAIHDGGQEQLRFGVWRRPNTSSPDKGSNTVLVGHRFTYDENGVFYHLDKVKPGDKITLHWDGKAYNYTVEKQLVVKASAVEIEAPTEESLLTIYTCTPLWSAKDRLVIIAKPEEI